MLAYSEYLQRNLGNIWVIFQNNNHGHKLTVVQQPQPGIHHPLETQSPSKNYKGCIQHPIGPRNSTVNLSFSRDSAFSYYHSHNTSAGTSEQIYTVRRLVCFWVQGSVRLFAARQIQVNVLRRTSFIPPSLGSRFTPQPYRTLLFELTRSTNAVPRRNDLQMIMYFYDLSATDPDVSCVSAAK